MGTSSSILVDKPYLIHVRFSR